VTQGVGPGFKSQYCKKKKWIINKNKNFVEVADTHHGSKFRTQVWWCMPIISALWRLRQENWKFEAIHHLGYHPSSRQVWATEWDPVTKKTDSSFENELIFPWLLTLDSRTKIRFWKHLPYLDVGKEEPQEWYAAILHATPWGNTASWHWEQETTSEKKLSP
jgi:hypothetical protein